MPSETRTRASPLIEVLIASLGSETKEGSTTSARTNCCGDLGRSLESHIHYLMLQPLRRLRRPPSNLGCIARRIMQAAWTGSKLVSPQA